MKRQFTILVLAAAAATLVFTQNPVTAQSANREEAALKAATDKETLQGDLKGALDAYKKLSASKDPSIAARALLGMAESYRKMGDAEAKRLYERILRDYPNQKDVVTTARARLAGNARQPDEIQTRRLLTGRSLNPYGDISPDGRYLTFIDYTGEASAGDVGLHDFSTGQTRRLTSGKGTEFGDSSVISPDGRDVAYAWFNGETEGGELRVVSISDPRREPRVLLKDDEGWIDPQDWSGDGRWIAVLVTKDIKQIGLVNSANGQLRILKSLNWRSTSNMFFSPDSKYIAFDLTPEDDSTQRDVLVLAVDGTREINAVVHPAMDVVMGWTPDGKHLLFASNRSASNSLYALPFRDGKPGGSPIRIKSDIGWASPIGMTPSGAYYYGSRVGGWNVSIGTMDFESGKAITPPVPIEYNFGSNRQPSWSRDGKSLVYATRSYPRDRFDIVSVFSVETGRVREFQTRLEYFQNPNLNPDGTKIFVQGTNLEGRGATQTIDVNTGAIERIVDNAGRPAWSPDGKKIYYGNNRFVERDLATGSERVLHEDGVAGSANVSPKGDEYAYVASDPKKDERWLVVVPLAGGTPRRLYKIQSAGSWTEWTSDGKFILFPEQGARWMVSSAGGQPRKVNFGNGDGRLRIQPHGNRVVESVRNEDSHEIWVMENIIPTLK